MAYSACPCNTHESGYSLHIVTHFTPPTNFPESPKKKRLSSIMIWVHEFKHVLRRLWTADSFVTARVLRKAFLHRGKMAVVRTQSCSSGGKYWTYWPCSRHGRWCWYETQRRGCLKCASESSADTAKCTRRRKGRRGSWPWSGFSQRNYSLIFLCWWVGRLYRNASPPPSMTFQVFYMEKCWSSQTFQKRISYLSILGARRVTFSKFHSEDH